MFTTERLKDLLFDAVLLLYDKSLESYDGIDDDAFVFMVCEGLGISEQEYREIMFLDYSHGS